MRMTGRRFEPPITLEGHVMFEGFARFTSTRLKARRTAQLLNALPAEVQKDIGWKWSPRLRGNAIPVARLDYDLL